VKSAQAALLVARENTLAQRGLLSKCVRRLFRRPWEVILRGFAGHLLGRRQLQLIYAAGQRLVRARCFRFEPQNGGVAPSAAGAGQVCLGRNAYHAQFQHCRRRQEASLRGQISATQKLIEINTQILDTLRSQYAKGYASELDVAAEQAQLDQVVATLPPLRKQLAQQRGGWWNRSDLPKN
jgi:Outer membrane efflux protein